MQQQQEEEEKERRRSEELGNLLEKISYANPDDCMAAAEGATHRKAIEKYGATEDQWDVVCAFRASVLKCACIDCQRAQALL